MPWSFIAGKIVNLDRIVSVETRQVGNTFEVVGYTEGTTGGLEPTQRFVVISTGHTSARLARAAALRLVGLDATEERLADA